MPTSLQPTSGSVAASALLLALKAKLVGALVPELEQATSRYVRIIARPNPDYAEYKAEEGVALCLRSPDPEKNAGAGRWGKLTRRVLEVYVASENLSDKAGEDEILVTKHLDLEEAVVNVLEDWYPDKTGAVRVAWMPGGAEIERRVRTDPGVALSVLLFELTYVPPIEVNRV